MKQYHFWKAFLRYTTLLILLLIALFISIILMFSWDVNHEINETAEGQTASVKYAIEHNNKVNEGHSFFIMNGKTVEDNHTPFTEEELKHRFVDKVKTPHVDESHKGIFDIRTTQLSNNRTLYSLTNVRDFYETKQFLNRELLIAFIFTFILMIAMAYYLARRPVIVYEKLMEEQQTFVQNASHEMKTPIASLLLGTQYLEMLDKNHWSEEGRNTLSQMKTEVSYMQQLIETMLQDNIDNDKAESVDISKIFDEIIATTENIYQTTIQRRYQSQLTFTIKPLHAIQILNILLENAFHHNSSNVQVNVSAFKTMNGLQIEVSDNGKGIDKAEQDKIFQRFYQVDKGMKGSGIGLSLLRNIIYQYGGTIEVESQLEKGTKFIIKL